MALLSRIMVSDSGGPIKVVGKTGPSLSQMWKLRFRGTKLLIESNYVTLKVLKIKLLAGNQDWL